MQRFLVDYEACLRNDAVHPFLLHAGQTTQGLVCNILAQPRQTDFIAAQMHNISNAAANVLYGKNSCFIGHDLVTRMVFPFDGDQFTCGCHHFPPQQIVKRRSIFKSHGATGIFRNIAAN